jgi:hypothetical protein
MPCFPNKNRFAVIQLGVAMTLESSWIDSSPLAFPTRESYLNHLQDDSEYWSQTEEETDSNIAALDSEEHLQAYEEWRTTEYVNEDWKFQGEEPERRDFF